MILGIAHDIEQLTVEGSFKTGISILDLTEGVYIVKEKCNYRPFGKNKMHGSIYHTKAALLPAWSQHLSPVYI